ncbi:MAG: hypothetical protein WDM87_00705 [Terracidiphilus sp.]
MYKIAIAGASSLVGRELKEVLSESPLASSTFSLFDEADAHGQLDQVGDEVTFIKPIDVDSFDHTDFTFFCGSEGLTRRHWQQALRAGSTVLDLTAALDREAGVVVRAPWLGPEASTVDLFTPAVVPAHPAVVALCAATPAVAAGGSAAFCRRYGDGAGQRIWPSGYGRAAPANRKPAQLPVHAEDNLRRPGGIQPAWRHGRELQGEPFRCRSAHSPTLRGADHRSRPFVGLFR